MTPAPAAGRDPGSPPPQPAHSSAGVPSLPCPPPTPSAHLVASGLPERLSGGHGGDLPGAGRGGVRRRPADPERARGLPPPLAGSPGGRRRTRAPGAAAAAAPAAGARPGSASWGGSEGRGTGARAHAAGSARRPDSGRGAPREPLLKGQCPRLWGPPGADREPSYGRRKARWTLASGRVTVPEEPGRGGGGWRGFGGFGGVGGGPWRGPRPRTRARRRRRRRAQGRSRPSRPAQG